MPLLSERFEVPAHLLRLSAPVIASMISRTVMGFVDFAMVSKLGTEAQAAIMPSSLVLFSVISFGMGSVSMVNTFVSQALGRGQPGECAAYTWQGVHLSLLLWLVALPGFLLVRPLFAWVGHAPAVQRLEIQYAQIGLIGVGPTLVAFALSGFYTGIHRAAIPLASAIIGNIFNVAANYALIYGHWGFPAMGIAGAAWATVLASVVNALVLLVWILLPYYHHRFQTRAMWRFDLARFVRLCRFGLPAGVHFAADIITWTIFTNVFVGRFGKEQLAGHNIAMQILHLSFMPAYGLGQALAVMVGKNIGEGRLSLAKSAVRWTVLFTFVYMGGMGLAMALWRRELVALFNQDPQVILWGGRIMIFCALFQVFDAMNLTFVHALRGAGDTHWCAGAILVSSIVVLMGGSALAVALVPQWGSAGPWIACTLYVAIIGLLFAARYRWGPWEKLELFHKHEHEALAVGE